jgi:hypothetical protein
MFLIFKEILQIQIRAKMSDFFTKKLQKVTWKKSLNLASNISYFLFSKFFGDTLNQFSEFEDKYVFFEFFEISKFTYEKLLTTRLFLYKVKILQNLHQKKLIY